MDDAKKKHDQCSKKFIEWKGSEVIYLGENKWAFSARTNHEVIISCPATFKDSPFRTIQLPPIGIFEIPSGCSARTGD